MPTKVATYFVQSTAQGTSALVTPSFTPGNGETLIVMLATWDTTIAMNAPTGGGLTYTSRVVNAPGGFREWCAIYTASVVSSPGSMTVTSSPASSARYSMCVERWSGAQLAATPVTSSADGPNSTAAGSITPSAGTSVISWVAGDAQSVNPSTRAYLGSGTDEGVRDDYATTDGVDYYGWQASTGTGSQSYGLSAPTGMYYVIAAIEVQDSGGGAAAIPPILVMAPRR